VTTTPPETPPEPTGPEPKASPSQSSAASAPSQSSAASASSGFPPSGSSPSGFPPSGSSPSGSPPSGSPPSGSPGASSDSSSRSKQPSLAPGAALLVLAGVLIVIVLIKPDMPDWLRTTIAILAVVVVIGLLAYAFVVFRETTRGGSR